MTLKSLLPENAAMEPANTKTIVVWGSEDYMLAAVEKLLATRSDWRAFRISADRDAASLVSELKRINPDVLIVSEGVAGCGRGLMKIITISQEDNMVEIYHKQTLGIKKASDLLSLIDDVAPE